MKNSPIPLVDGGKAGDLTLRRRATSISALLLGALALSACGATNPAPATLAHGSLDLARALPAPTPTPFAAYGAHQTPSGTHVSPGARASIAPYLRAPKARLARAAPAPAVPVTAAVPDTAVAAVAPEVRLAAATTHVPAHLPHDSQLAVRAHGPDEATSAASGTGTTRSDADRYAGRQSRELEGYRGGDVIVITASTLIIILLVAVVVLLIT